METLLARSGTPRGLKARWSWARRGPRTPPEKRWSKGPPSSRRARFAFGVSGGAFEVEEALLLAFAAAVVAFAFGAIGPPRPTAAAAPRPAPHGGGTVLGRACSLPP